jgi:membrane fusion protein (multidrug efflux system)
MTSRTRISLFLVLLVLLVSCSKEQEKPALPPPDLSVYETVEQEVPIHHEFVGQVSGFKDIAIRARVEGFLEGIHFEEGSRIEKGALLYTIESQPFEADVAAKMSNVAEARTKLAKAQSDLDRIRPLAELKAVSQSDLDSAVAQYEAAAAVLEAAQANLRAASIQLSYTKVHSPISGIIGKTKAKVGDFVGQSPNPVILNVVSRTDIILVEFFLGEAQFLKLARTHLSEEGFDDGKYRVTKLELVLVDGSVYEQKGKFDFIDREVDPTTGAILVQTSFPNPDQVLRPGQFAKVRISMITSGILIPQRCVMELQGMHRIYVVNDKNEVETREVTVGPTVKDFWLITDGLDADEKVVYEGLQRAKAGMVVNPVVQDIQPPAPDKQ